MEYIPHALVLPYEQIKSTDVNECEEDSLNNCDDNSGCTNTIGSYDCFCLSGFEGDGFNCSGMFKCLPMISLILLMHFQTLMSATEQRITVISMLSVVTTLDHLNVLVTWDTPALESFLTVVSHKMLSQGCRQYI